MKNFRIDSLAGTPLGKLYFAVSAHGLAALAFEGQNAPAWRAAFPQREADPALERLAGDVRLQLSEYLAGNRQTFDLPLDRSGWSEFQAAVYETVAEVPFGETRTYREIAIQISRPLAYRAVGRANASNPIAIVIPCHRLIGTNGSLRGYGGGLHRKAWLLAHERG